MKNKLKSLLIPILLGGIWGVFAHLIVSFMSSKLSLASSLFYPLLFGGIALITAITLEFRDHRVPCARALVVGLMSGFIYHILSPIFPFLSSVLAGASLGGGLAVDEGKLKDVFSRLIFTLKGVFLFPVFIYSGGLLASLISVIPDSHILLWFFWGGWIGLGICLISTPVFKTFDTEQDFQTLSEVDEFKSEAQQVLSELDQLKSRFS